MYGIIIIKSTVLPGTTDAANVKAKFLKDIILKKNILKEISSNFAFAFSFTNLIASIGE